MADRGDYEKRDEEEDEDDELGEADYKAQKDAVIFAIEVSKSMLAQPTKSADKKADKDSAVSAALNCAYQIMQQRIISNPKDMMGIVFFNTEKTQFQDENGHSNLTYPHCYVYVDLNVPSADDVKALKDLVEDGDDSEEILVPSEERVAMTSLLFCANQMFVTKAPNFGSRRLFIITDNDDPHPNDKKAKDYASQRAKDLYDLGATVDLFPISRGDAKFDLTKFYNDIIFHDPAAEETSSHQVATSKSGDGLTLLGSLVSNINSKQTPKRAYFSNMPLELGPGLRISVKGYNVIHRQAPARSCYVWLDDEKAQIAVSHTAHVADDSARTLESLDVKKAYKFGGEYVFFEDDEIKKQIKAFEDPIIRVIGFKNRSLLKPWASLKKSIFIFPSEEGFVGSTRVFSALWQKLLKSNKIGIAWHIARKNANPQLVAIIPSKSQSDKDSGTQFLPAGLWLYPLPSVDDLRVGPETKGAVETTEELTKSMNTVVAQLQLPGANYNPMKYPNPALQWHYRILQALALEEEVPDKPADATVPRYRSIHKRCGADIQDWSSLADKILEKVKEKQAIKRDMDDDDDEEIQPKAKKPKTTAPKTGGGSMKDAELIKRVEASTLSKLTVAELKNAMGERGLETKGLKKDLLERFEQWIEDNL